MHYIGYKISILTVQSQNKGEKNNLTDKDNALVLSKHLKVINKHFNICRVLMQCSTSVQIPKVLFLYLEQKTGIKV